MSSARVSTCSAREQVAEPDADLAERGERDGQAVHRAGVLVQRQGAVGERQRLVVAVAHERDVGLVAAHERQHVLGARHGGQVLGLPQRRHRLVEPSRLRRHDADQRVTEREVAAVARGVEGRDRLGDLLAHDRRVADLAVAHAQLVVREADGPRVERELRLLEGAAEQGDGARLVAAQRGEAAVEAPERRELRRRDPLAQHVGRAAEHRGGLRDVVAQQPRFGHRAADGQFVLAPKPRRVQRVRERVERLGASSALERGRGARHRRLKGLGGHGESITARGEPLHPSAHPCPAFGNRPSAFGVARRGARFTADSRTPSAERRPAARAPRVGC